MKSDDGRLRDILASIDALERHVAGLTKETFAERFEEDLLFSDAISYRFIIIGEAIGALLADPPAPIVTQNQVIDWRGYKNMRNILTHQYLRRAPVLIWAAITNELPALKQAVSAAIHTSSQPSS